MAERMLITKLVRTEQTRADLYAKGHRWPDLKLFDLSDLVEVGIKPDDLPIGQEVPCRFWAIYELSDKTNQAGNAYRDIITLERVDAPATTTSADTSALLVELRAIRGLLEALAAQGGIAIPAESHGPDWDAYNLTGQEGDNDDGGLAPGEVPVSILYGDGTAVSDNQIERTAFAAFVKVESAPPRDRSMLRKWYAEQDSN